MARKKKTPKTNVNDNNNKTATNKTLITPTVNTPQTCLPTLVHTLKQECSESNGFIEHKDIQGDIKDACNNTIVVVTAPVQERNQDQNNCNCKSVDSSDDQMPEIKALKYQSDSELMDLRNYEKNKSNLFLIKSYSFIDKTNNKRKTQQQYGKPPKLKEIKFNDKFTKNISSMEVKNFENTEQEKIVKSCEKPEKPKKPPKLKKMKKAKSTHDSTENLHELQQLLRRPTPPSIVLQDTDNVKRPLSLPPVTANRNHKPVAKAKTLDDIETPRLKRDSFLRHSLQSIRRSFSSSKKSTNPSHISCSSNSSSSSSSNCSSVSVPNRKLFKTKDQLKDVANLSEIEEDANYLIAVKEEDDQAYCTATNTSISTSEPCNVITNLNNSNTNVEPIDNTSTSHLSRLSPPASALLHSTMDSSSLAVLKEEDEKDFNHNHTQPPCVINEQRSTSSVSTLAQLPTDSLSPMAPLQTHTECQSVQCLNILDKDYKSSSSSSTTTTGSSSSPPQQQKAKRASFQHQLSIPESLQSTSIGCVTSSEYSSARSLKHSATSLTPLQTLNSSSSLRSISPLRRSASSNSSSTAKHEQSTAAATAAAAATATTSNGTSATSTATATPPEKEKKRKEISSSRVKKFHRHFAQVSKDEKLINYFSCALVSDILLQGHLYITDHHFAFYSNVFGYVTKVVIPTSSVTKISKEKTAKIIPNAVGVATADERHVFGSFISREAAFRLMCSVCPPLGVPEILPKDPASIEISEEYSIEDDSSCSISGNESPAQAIELLNSNSNNTNGNLHNDASQTILRRSVGSSNLSIADAAAATATADKLRHSDIPINAKKATNTASSRSSAPPSTVAAQFTNSSSNGGAAADGGVVNLVGLKTVLTPTQEDSGDASKLTIIAGCASTSTSATSTPTPSTASMPTTVMTLPSSKAKHVINIFRNVSQKLMTHVKFPTEIHVVYLGVMLTLLLALFSIFLLYRILDIEAKTNGYRSPIEFNWRSGNDDDIFTEALRFQKQLQLKSTEEAQNILKTNLEQIAKVRRSLETLSMLIHDRSSSFVSTNTDDSD